MKFQITAYAAARWGKVGQQLATAVVEAKDRAEAHELARALHPYVKFIDVCLLEGETS